MEATTTARGNIQCQHRRLSITHIHVETGLDPSGKLLILITPN